AAAVRHPGRTVATGSAHCRATHAVRPHAAPAEAPIVLLGQPGGRAEAALHDERIGGALIEVGNLFGLDRAIIGDGARRGRLVDVQSLKRRLPLGRRTRDGRRVTWRGRRNRWAWL